MVRLQSSGPGDGAHPQVIDQLLSTAGAGSKRTRAQSSLDFKLPGTETLSANNNNRRGESVESSSSDKNQNIVVVPPSEQSQNQQKGAKGAQQQEQQTRPKIATRARGSSGIPPRSKLDMLRDLEGMTEEQVMEALMADPELADLASEKFGQGRDEPPQRESSSTSSGMERNATGTDRTSKSKSRIDKSIQEKGVPYEQWAVLLVMLGIGFYQLYKALSGPTAGHKKNTKKDIGSKGGGGKSHKGSGGKNKKARGNTATISGATKESDNNKVTSPSLDVDKVVAEIEGKQTLKETKTSVPKKPTSANNKSAKKKKPKQATITETPNKPGIETLTDVATTTKKTAATSTPITRGVINADDYGDGHIDDNNDDWATVSKTKGGNVKAKAAGKDSTIMTAEQEQVLPLKENIGPKVNGEDAAPKPLPLTSVETNVEPNVVPIVKKAEEKAKAALPQEETRNDNVTSLAKATSNAPKNKKKKKKTSGTAHANGSTNATMNGGDTTAADEALALKLQQEEEKLAALEESAAAATAPSKDEKQQQVVRNEDDAWAEVTTKKGKRANNPVTIAVGNNNVVPPQAENE